MKKVLIIILAIVIVAIFAVGGYFAYQKYSTPKTETPIIQTVGSAPISVAGWKTYTNTQYGFEFQYPDELTVVQKASAGGGDGFGLKNSAGDYEDMVGLVMSIKDFPNKNQEALYKDLLGQKKDWETVPGMQDFKVLKFNFRGNDGVIAYSFYSQDRGYGCTTALNIFHGDYIFQMNSDFNYYLFPQQTEKCPKNQQTTPTDANLVSALSKIVSTFKFTK